jgi:hypothetical protein
MKEQHAAALHVHSAATAKAEAELVELAASHAAAISEQGARHTEAIAELKAENAALKVQAASTLKKLLAAITTGAMEILPVRPDRRQFVEWRVGGIPPPPPPLAVPLVPQFDRAWCAGVCIVGGWKADVDAAAGDVRAKVTQAGSGFSTFRSAVPLPRNLTPHIVSEGHQQPSYRVIVEAHGRNEFCRLGFVPSHHTRGDGAATAVRPAIHYSIYDYGGWYIEVQASRASGAHDAQYNGWTIMAPGDSAYATTTVVPPVPAGGAVEFAVDYAAGTCRVAFYTPAAVMGGFMATPHAKMELRFVATAAGKSASGRPTPARTVPTAANSGVALYPAVEAYAASGNVWRFAAV